VSFTVNDGDEKSSVLTRDVQIIPTNDAPVLTSIEAQAADFTEDGSPVGLTGNINISDLDDTNIESATVAITDNFVNGEDQLNFSSQNGISGSYDVATGILSLSGSATLAEYQTALRTITYTNNSDSPSNATRTLSVTVNDGDNNSNTAARDIQISPVNDAPGLTSIEAQAATFIENGSPVGLTGNIIVSDIDDTDINSATVSITGNFTNGEDQLNFTNLNGIFGSYDAATGILSLSGNATLAQYQTALRTITYVNTSDNPSTLTRTLSVTVNDGDADSNISTRDIQITPVNDAPALTNTESLPLRFDEGESPTGLTSTINLSDIDNTTIESATVFISGNYSGGEDILNFTDQNGISGSYNPTIGTLLLSGSATLAEYQSALQSVTYQNNSENPR